MNHLTPAAPNEHYARTDSGELIGPYETVEECESERLAANSELAEASQDMAYQKADQLFDKELEKMFGDSTNG